MCRSGDVGNEGGFAHVAAGRIQEISVPPSKK